MIFCLDICDVDFTVLPSHCSLQTIQQREETVKEEEEEEEEEESKNSKKEENISLRDFPLDCIEMITKHHKTINLK